MKVHRRYDVRRRDDRKSQMMAAFQSNISVMRHCSDARVDISLAASLSGDMAIILYADDNTGITFRKIAECPE